MHPLLSLSVPAGKVAIHWFEQSAYAIKDSKDTVTIVDPYFPRERPLDRFAHGESPLDEKELPVDFILVTHNHLDHTDPETISRLYEASPGLRCVGPKESVANITGNTPVPGEHVLTIDAGQTLEIGTMMVSAVYAKPPEGDPERGIKAPDVTHLGYVVKAEGIGMYFTGDLLNTFAEREDLVGAVAALKPEIGFLTTHPDEGEFPFFDGSVKMACRIGLKVAVPAHYECFAKRNYDPEKWAAAFPNNGPTPRIIPRNSSIIYPE